MFCHKCGTQIPEGFSFCIGCGTAVPAASAEPAADTQETMVFNPVAEPTSPAATSEAPVYVPDYPNYTNPVTKPEPKNTAETYTQKPSSNGRTAIIIAIAVVLVALIVVLGIVFLPNILSGETEDIRGNKGGIVDGSGSEEATGITPSNPYYDDFIDADSYLLSDTAARYYSRSELSHMTRQQLYLAERELLARYGCTFDNGDLDEFFCSKNWYTPDSPAENFNESRFTPVERVNLLLLRAMLMERDGTTGSNEYLKLNNNVEGWILNFTDNSRIAKSDVIKLTETELVIAYNEIYARKGYIFEDDALQLYFASKNWYVPETLSSAFDATTALTEIEQDNYIALQECARKLSGVRFSADNPFAKYCTYSGYMIAYSDRQLLKRSDLTHLSDEQLTVARNEIYARYGYGFTGSQLREYFMNCSWYYPTVSPGKLAQIHLTDTEEKNVLLILEIEEERKLTTELDKLNTTLNQKITTDCYTLYLPAYWKDHCTYVNDNPEVFFYEKQNKSNHGCGYLFSIQLIPIDTDLDDIFEDWHIEGYLTDPSGRHYYVMRRGPTDVNCVVRMELYIKMLGEIDRIMDTVEWKSGYTFSTTKPEIEEPTETPDTPETTEPTEATE